MNQYFLVFIVKTDILYKFWLHCASREYQHGTVSCSQSLFARSTNLILQSGSLGTLFSWFHLKKEFMILSPSQDSVDANIYELLETIPSKTFCKMNLTVHPVSSVHNPFLPALQMWLFSCRVETRLKYSQDLQSKVNKWVFSHWQRGKFAILLLLFAEEGVMKTLKNTCSLLQLYFLYIFLAQNFACLKK